MNLHELFRSFMGFPNRRDPGLGEPTYRDDSGSGFGGDGSPYDGSFFAEPWEMLRHFEDVFRHFGLAEFPHGAELDEGSRREDLRDRMLKVPDYTEPFWGSQMPHLPVGPHFPSGPGQLEDNRFRDMDLDDHVAARGIDSLLAQPPDPGVVVGVQPQPDTRGSTSMHTFTSINGKVEEKRVTTDAEGNQVVSVTRSLGDRSHTVTTRTGPQGSVQTEEHFVNMDEGDKAKFDEMWGSASSGPSFVPRQLVPSVPGDPSYGRQYLPTKTSLGLLAPPGRP
uniref:Putative hcls1 associated protein x-1 n=1 Tax=Ixodes ricinus TaxID=34613 RepID=V5H0D1_IXORI